MTFYANRAYHGHLTTTIAISPYKFQKINDGKKEKWVHVVSVSITCTYKIRIILNLINLLLSGSIAMLIQRKIYN